MACPEREHDLALVRVVEALPHGFQLRVLAKPRGGTDDVSIPSYTIWEGPDRRCRAEVISSRRRSPSLDMSNEAFHTLAYSLTQSSLAACPAPARWSRFRESGTRRVSRLLTGLPFVVVRLGAKIRPARRASRLGAALRRSYTAHSAEAWL